MSSKKHEIKPYIYRRRIFNKKVNDDNYLQCHENKYQIYLYKGTWYYSNGQTNQTYQGQFRYPVWEKLKICSPQLTLPLCSGGYMCS